MAFPYVRVHGTFVLSALLAALSIGCDKEEFHSHFPKKVLRYIQDGKGKRIKFSPDTVPDPCFSQPHLPSTIEVYCFAESPGGMMIGFEYRLPNNA